jgi:hypothetical protein
MHADTCRPAYIASLALVGPGMATIAPIIPVETIASHVPQLQQSIDEMPDRPSLKDDLDLFANISPSALLAESIPRLQSSIMRVRHKRRASQGQRRPNRWREGLSLLLQNPPPGWKRARESMAAACPTTPSTLSTSGVSVFHS